MAKIETRPTTAPDGFYDPPPHGWEVRDSRSRPGVKCFVNLRTGRRQFRRPKPDRIPVDGEESTNSASSEAGNKKKEAKASLVKSDASADPITAGKVVDLPAKVVSSKVSEISQPAFASSEVSPLSKVVQTKRAKAPNANDAVRNNNPESSIKGSLKNKDDNSILQLQTNETVKGALEHFQIKLIENKKQHVLEEALYLTDQRNLIGQVAELNDGKPPQTYEVYSRIVMLPAFAELEVGSCITFQDFSMKQNHDSVAFGVISEIAVLMERNDNSDHEQVRLRLHRLNPPPEVKKEQTANILHLSDIPTDTITLKGFQNIVPVAFNPKMRRFCKYYCPSIWSVARKSVVDVNRSGEFLTTNLCRILFGQVWEPGVDLRFKRNKSTKDSIVNITRVTSMPMRHVDLEEFDIMDESTWTAKTVDWHI